MKFQVNSPNPNEFMVEGLSALSEFIRHKPQSIKCIYSTLKHREQLAKLIGTREIRVEFLKETHRSDQALNSSVYAYVEIHYQSFQNLLQLLEKKSPHNLILALDHITDPRNLGAIARSAAFFGVKYILIPKMRQVLLTSASVSTSQGAFAYSELVLVANLSQSLEKLKELGYWVLSADSGGESYEQVRRTTYEKVVLVLGSEGSGVSDLVKKRSDRIISIDSRHKILDSLNVSVAAGILLNAFAT